MKRILFLVFLSLPMCLGAQESEIDQLKKELEEMRQLSALYESRIEAMERRLIAIEKQAEPSTAVPGPSAVEQLASGSATDEIPRGARPESDPAFTTGFDPRRFNYYGYMRAGYGVDKDGTSQSRFKAPGAGAAYRLGNENDTYMETGFSWYNVNREKEDSPIFGTHFMLAYSTLEKNTGVALEGDSGAVSLREAYASVRNLDKEQPQAMFWAGQRYYRRHDIHINDFFWLDMSGFGGGFENYDAGFAKVSLAWIGGTTDKFSGRNDYIGDLEDTDKNNFDLRFNDIDLGIGKGNVWLNYSRYRFSSTEIALRDADGWSGGFWLVSDLNDDTNNTAAIQYGTSVAANFNSFSPSLRTSIEGDFPEGTIVEDQRRLRLFDVLNFRFGERWSAQAVAIYQHDDLGLEENTDVKWYSVGFRPIYSFNELYNLAIEAGYDYTELENGEEGGLLKLTAAAEITPDMNFFSRPALRFFLTYATWSDEFQGLIGGKTYADDTDGFSMGVQFESWW
ncbi:MAG: carbohydrate porin [Xanthomonadales bacterium]|jgi:maltoporin|nr:carbohydrate porin [Xanthomonadales bacterium]